MHEDSIKRAKTYDEIEPLVKLCRLGKLFEVQEWISAGKPVNPPENLDRRVRKRFPLYLAIESGFHSLVKMLLDGGTVIDEPGYSPLEHALHKRRLDLIQLLVEHGADIHSVSMRAVFQSWDPMIVEFFIDNGANVEAGNPLAYALCSKIRPALGLFKRYKDRYPSFQEQANIALRHHCCEGSLKWVSLMLWAGADPYAKGPDSPDRKSDPEADASALELAAIYDHFDIFKLRQVRLDPNKPGACDLLRSACYSEKPELLKKLLGSGFNPQSMEDRGSSLIQCLLSRLSWSHRSFYSWGPRTQEENIDNWESRDKIKMIHLLARHGAKWKPNDRREINDARRSLLKMKPDYTVEFIWIMSGYQACTRETIEELMRPKPIRTLVLRFENRVKELMETFTSFEPET
ncbi:MAG: ankyrin repeat domain-containing protein [Syntrophaceae bacterium]|nr:ankyrin repeat domain-containing protein [Syntrophaceae bacterium]